MAQRVETRFSAFEHFESRDDDRRWSAEGSSPQIKEPGSFWSAQTLEDPAPIVHNEPVFENIPQAGQEALLDPLSVDAMLNALCKPGSDAAESPSVAPSGDDQQHGGSGVLLRLTVPPRLRKGFDEDRYTASTEAPTPSPGRKKRSVSESDEGPGCDTGDAFVSFQGRCNRPCSVSRCDVDRTEELQQPQCWGDACHHSRGLASRDFSCCAGPRASPTRTHQDAGQLEVLEQRRTDSGPTACHATTVKRRQTANQNTAVAGKERAKEPRVGHAVHRNAGNVKEFDVVDGLRANPDRKQRRTSSLQTEGRATGGKDGQTTKHRMNVAGDEGRKQSGAPVLVPGIYRDSGTADEYPVEDILDARRWRPSRKARYRWKYFIKWEDCSEGENSWVSERNIPLNSAFKDKMKRLRERVCARLASKKRPTAPRPGHSRGGAEQLSSGSTGGHPEKGLPVVSNVGTSPPEDSGCGRGQSKRKQNKSAFCSGAMEAKGSLSAGRAGCSKRRKEESSAYGVAQQNCPVKRTSYVEVNPEAAQSSVQDEKISTAWGSGSRPHQKAITAAGASNGVGESLSATAYAGSGCWTAARAEESPLSNGVPRVEPASSDDTSSDTSSDSSLSSDSSGSSESDTEGSVDKQFISAPPEGSGEKTAVAGCLETGRIDDAAQSSVSRMQPQVIDKLLPAKLPEGRSAQEEASGDWTLATRDKGSACVNADQDPSVRFGAGRGKGVFLRRPPDQKCQQQANHGSQLLAGFSAVHTATGVRTRYLDSGLEVTARQLEGRGSSLSGSAVTAKSKYLFGVERDSHEGDCGDLVPEPGEAASPGLGVDSRANTELRELAVRQSIEDTGTGYQGWAASSERSGTEGCSEKQTDQKERCLDHVRNPLNELPATTAGELPEVGCGSGKRMPIIAAAEALSRADTAADMDEVAEGTIENSGGAFYPVAAQGTGAGTEAALSGEVAGGSQSPEHAPAIGSNCAAENGGGVWTKAAIKPGVLEDRAFVSGAGVQLRQTRSSHNVVNPVSPRTPPSQKAGHDVDGQCEESALLRGSSSAARNQALGCGTMLGDDIEAVDYDDDDDCSVSGYGG